MLRHNKTFTCSTLSWFKNMAVNEQENIQHFLTIRSKIYYKVNMKWCTLILIDLMHWRHVSITTMPCWGSRLVALRARVVLAERIGAQPLSQCAGPGQPGGMACRGWPSGCMLGDGARGSASFDPQHAGAPFCDVICIWSILNQQKNILFVALGPIAWIFTTKK